MQQQLRYHEIGSKFGHKSPRGLWRRSWRLVGVPKGSQIELWEWETGSMDLLGHLDGVNCSSFVQCGIHVFV